ncbi:hypothetical protein FMUND_15014 [Fusarium mundagurra]|uniref:Heterokaryon incompatibility domain-containing protein n=1 Tax=Fusarium mundagurra TaxID=1567541 RepID=A0A8H5XS42_9HYPO|nr:hypothetical protein FMUND_15014 [Fusarium mundagurra]
MKTRKGRAGISAARLCKKCEAVKFNDRDAGGIKGVSKNGKTCLNMNSSVLSQSHSQLEMGWHLKLDYCINDVLPRLPILAKSARSGCDFCGFLRTTILSKEGNIEEMIRELVAGKATCGIVIRLYYKWSPPEDHSLAIGMLYLLVFLSVNGHDDDGVMLIFNVEGLEGSEFLKAPSGDSILESLAERLAGIDDRQLTPALYDAVAVARSLSIPYLWVDALCILQDSRADWERESCVMDKIYGNAAVTIAALASTSCNEGFCLAKRPELYIPYSSSINPEVDGFCKVRFLLAERSISNTMIFDDSIIIRANVRECLWSSRGWTFQESALSRRILGFGTSELCFLCPSSSQYMGGQELQKTFLAQLGTFFWDPCNSSSNYANWADVVTEYSHRSNGYTHVTDILPAISGLAAKFGEILQVQKELYVGGLWKGDLLLGTLWYISSANPVKRPCLAACVESLATSDPYIAPSWSWANRGQVSFMHGTYSNLRGECQLEAWTTLKGANPYGEVTNGLLRITGKARHLHSDLEILNTEPLHHLRQWISRDTSGNRWYYRLDWDPPGNRESPEKLKMVLTGSASRPNAARRIVFGLLIHEAGPSNPDKFYRVVSLISRSLAQFVDILLQWLHYGLEDIPQELAAS